MSRALLPVKSSAPSMTTSMRPMGNMQPDRSFCNPGLLADISGKPNPTISDSVPPNAMNAPARMACVMSRGLLLRVACTFAWPAASDALAISAGELILMM